MSNEKIELGKALAGLTLTALSAYFGTLLLPVLILLTAMVADYVSGMVKAWVTSALSSRVGIRGIVKKLCYLLAVVAGMGVDYVLALVGEGGADLPLACPMTCMVAVWLILNELISILENLRDIGVPLPVFLVKAVDRLKNKSDEE